MCATALIIGRFFCGIYVGLWEICVLCVYFANTRKFGKNILASVIKAPYFCTEIKKNMTQARQKTTNLQLALHELDARVALVVNDEASIKNIINMEQISKTPATAMEQGADYASAGKTTETTMTLPESKHLPQACAVEEHHPTADQDEITRLHYQELERIAKDSRYNCALREGRAIAMDLKHFVLEGGKLYTPSVNRTHGGDLKKTGASIVEYGAQEALTVEPVRVLIEAGLEIKPFSGDIEEEIDESGLCVINGNGRIKYLTETLEASDWPELNATFIQPDKNSQINPAKAFSEMNIHVSKWGASDMAMKRLVADGEEAHPGWKFIHDLQKEGYKYQAASQVAALGNDRITSKKVENEDADIIFSNFEYAVKIHQAISQEFGDNANIKGKMFTRQVSTVFDTLCVSFNKSEATKELTRRISLLPPEIVESIKTAKKSADGLSRDQVAANLLKGALMPPQN